MAVAAFKSSSRRGNQTREEARSNKAPIRRSRSVSALSRSNLDISTEFLNKRDNPLFDEDKTQSTISLLPETSKFGQTTHTPDLKGPGSADSNCCYAARGRSVTRNGSAPTGRSLSRVDTGRRTRSASQCPVSRRHCNYSTSESEAESKDNRKGGLFESDDRLMDQVQDLHHTWSSHRSSIEVSDSFAATFSGLQTQNCDDAVSTASSGYVSDEKTIKAVCEQKPVQGDQLEASDIYETVRSEVRRAISEIQNDLQSAIQRSNPTAIAFTNVADIPLDLVNPGAVELVLEIRREYARKLEESQERARNLRADLAVEEQRGQELDRILKEELPYPITPTVQKSRPARKVASIERRRMSKRLEEDAKAYFDECVSLSTFDSSDFSSQEDPPLRSVGPPIPSGSHVCLPEESSIQGQFSSITSSTETGCKPCFSFAQKPSETSGLQNDIQQYIKKLEKNVSKLPTPGSNFCDLSEYSYQSSSESLLIDRVLLKNRIESGSVLLCGGGNILSSKSFVG